MSRNFWKTLTGIILFVIALCIVIALTACGSPSTPDAPRTDVTGTSSPATALEEVPVTTVNGEWKGGEEGFMFVAKIRQDTITIKIDMEDDTSALYWQGTFDSNLQPENSFESEADVDALASSILGSTEKTKVFEYTGDTIDFEFGMMGVTKVVHLEQQ